MVLQSYRASVLAFVCAVVLTQSGCGIHVEDLLHIRHLETAPSIDGKVILYPPGHFVRHAVVQADLSLPPQPGNKDWYAVLIMLTAYPRKGVSGDPANIQIGIIRYRSHDFAPTAYIGIQKENERSVYRWRRDLRLEGDGGHVAIALTGERIAIEFNGRTLLSVPRREVFRKGARPYIQVAAQVNQAGDRVSGAIRNLLVQSDDDATLDPVTTPCVYEDPELHMTRSGNDYDAQGIFKAGSGFSMFVETFGHCE
jgi:hypothetical protein